MVLRLIPASLVLGPAVLLPFVLVALGACSGSNDASIFPAAQPDAAAACTPVPLDASYKPVWKKPTTAAAGKCNATQLQGFYQACLLGPLTGSACTSFVMANGDCSSCLQSDDTDPAYSAVIWHSDRAFYTFNTAGCIADQEGDDSATGCGAAYQAAVECEETACSACGVADYGLFPTCEKNASAECSTYIQALNSVCGSGLRDAGDPAADCTLVSSAQAAFLAIAPVFCGTPPGAGP